MIERLAKYGFLLCTAYWLLALGVIIYDHSSGLSAAQALVVICAVTACLGTIWQVESQNRLRKQKNEIQELNLRLNAGDRRV